MPPKAAVKKQRVEKRGVLNASHNSSTWSDGDDVVLESDLHDSAAPPSSSRQGKIASGVRYVADGDTESKISEADVNVGGTYRSAVEPKPRLPIARSSALVYRHAKCSSTARTLEPSTERIVTRSPSRRTREEEAEGEGDGSGEDVLGTTHNTIGEEGIDDSAYATTVWDSSSQRRNEEDQKEDALLAEGEKLSGSALREFLSKNFDTFADDQLSAIDALAEQFNVDLR